jgi:TonB family protein
MRRAAPLGLLITLGIHGVLVYVLWAGQKGSAEASGEVRDLIVTELVQLGKPREKFWLPKIKAPPRAKAPESVLKLTDDPTTAPRPPEAPRPEDAEVSKDLKKALERARLLTQVENDEPDEGLETGAAEGTAREATAGDAYATQIYNAIRRNWNVPVGLVSEDELSRLSVQIRIQVASDGKLGDATVVKPSGNQLFDNSCVQAVEATGQVPEPPLEVRARFARGAVLEFKRE